MKLAEVVGFLRMRRDTRWSTQRAFHIHTSIEMLPPNPHVLPFMREQATDKKGDRDGVPRGFKYFISTRCGSLIRTVHIYISYKYINPKPLIPWFWSAGDR